MNNISISFPPPEDAYSATYGDNHDDITYVRKFDPVRHNEDHKTTFTKDVECPIDFLPLAGREVLYHGGKDGPLHPISKIELLTWLKSQDFPPCPICRTVINKVPLLYLRPREIAKLPLPAPEERPQPVSKWPKWAAMTALVATSILGAAPFVLHQTPQAPFVPPRLTHPQREPKPWTYPECPNIHEYPNLVELEGPLGQKTCRALLHYPRSRMKTQKLDQLTKNQAPELFEYYPDVYAFEKNNFFREKCSKKVIEDFLSSRKNRGTPEDFLVEAAAHGRLTAVAIHSDRLSRETRKAEAPSTRFVSAIQAAAKFGEVTIIEFLQKKYKIKTDTLNMCLKNAAAEKDRLGFVTLLYAGASYFSDDSTLKYAQEIGLSKKRKKALSSLKTYLGL